MRLGILGAGHIAEKMAATVNAMDGVECLAVSSRTLSKAEDFGAKFGITRCYGSYEEMLQDRDVDLVYVASPHSEHYAHMKLCIEHGKPILCEKAFTANAAQAEEILALAKEKHIFVMEAMWIRFMPLATKLKEIAESGVIGEVRMVTANLGYAIEGKERLVNPALAGGALLDLGVYPINFASMLLGTEVDKVESSCLMHPNGVDAQESITLTYKNGAMAVLNCTMQAMSDRIGGIQGTKGYAVVENINNFQSISVYNAKYEKVAVYEAPKQISGYEYEVEECARALQNGWLESPLMPHKETLRIMKLTDTLRGQWNMRFPFE